VLIKSILAIGSAFIAAAAFAQAPLGTVETVNGIVTVTDGTTGGTAAQGKGITNGMRFVTTSGGSAVLRLNNGCVVRLQPNQAVTILQSMTCRDLLAAVQSVGVNVAGGSFQAGAFSTAGLAVGTLGLNKALPSSKSLSSR
jgi:hypothetical protein